MLKLKWLFPAFGIALLSVMSCGDGKDKSKDAFIPIPEEDGDATASFIPIDTGNRMISSYLESVNYQEHPDTLLSWTMDADGLRLYMENMDIQKVKIMLSHSQDYINAGHYGNAAGFSSGALTLVLAGVNEAGDYVFYGNENAINRVAPCPPSCPHGNAASPILTKVDR